jgi:hypothetical protein
MRLQITTPAPRALTTTTTKNERLSSEGSNPDARTKRQDDEKLQH